MEYRKVEHCQYVEPRQGPPHHSAASPHAHTIIPLLHGPQQQVAQAIAFYTRNPAAAGD